MNSLEFIATMTGHLAWPIAVGVVAFAFREPLLKLLKTIQTVRYAGAEVSFEREATEVQLALKDSAQAQGVEEPLLQITPPVSDEHASRVGRIVEAWKRIEETLRERITQKTGTTPKRSSDMLSLAVQHELLTSEQIQSLNGLRVMRNLAVHAPGSDFDERHVTQFTVLADALITLLNLPNQGNQGSH